jgi:hypothetical protein
LLEKRDRVLRVAGESVKACGLQAPRANGDRIVGGQFCSELGKLRA